jgi:hypothetical protein
MSSKTKDNKPAETAAPKEKSGEGSVPLLTYPCTPEQFTLFERAWQSFAERTYPLEGYCFRNAKYEEVDAPTQENQATTLALFRTPSAKEAAFASIVVEHLKEARKREAEKRLIHGGLLSVLSTRSVDVAYATDPTCSTGSRDPLKLWKAILKTHKSGVHHMTPIAARVKLLNDFTNCRQRHSETNEEFAQRFRTTARIYFESIAEAARLSEQELANRFCHALHPVRNASFAEEIMRRECNGTDLPTTVEAVVVLAHLYQSAQATVERAQGKHHQAVAYAVETKEDWVKQARCHYCGKIGHLKKDCRKRAKDGKAAGGEPESKGPTVAAIEVNTSFLEGFVASNYSAVVEADASVFAIDKVW